MKVGSSAVIVAMVLADANAAGDAATVWTFTASFANPQIQAYDLAAGNALADFAALPAHSAKPADDKVQQYSPMGKLPRNPAPSPPMNSNRARGGMFDGVPPVIYTKDTRPSMVAPYSAALESSLPVALEHTGIAPDPVAMLLIRNLPPICTANGLDLTRSVTLNDDGTINSAANPARQTPTVTLLAIGKGRAAPRGVEGWPVTAQLPVPLLSVAADIGGAAVDTLYFGAAPALPARVFRVNFRVPANAPPVSASAVLRAGKGASLV